jgi:site-specific DNA-methyltransferase (adenine-specific)
MYRGGDNLDKLKLNQGDAVDWLRTLPTQSVDLVITDPPYESLEKHRAVGTTTRLKHSKSSSNDWFSIFPNARFQDLFSEVYRVLRKDSHFYLFCDPETAFAAKPIAEACGFKFWKPLVWDKKRIGMGYHYRARYEFILFFEKGKRKLSNLGTADILEVPRIPHGYPAEKPVAVSEILILQSSLPSEIVVDPFMGSGSVGEAALKHDRHFWGNDLSSTAATIAQNRLLQFQLKKAALNGEFASQQLGTPVPAKVWANGAQATLNVGSQNSD